MKALSPSDLSDFLSKQPMWRYEDGTLVRDWNFKDFLGAMEFVNHVARIAEEAGHHPDIDIRYNRVRLGLVTHDAGGVTERDIEMAAQLNKTFPM